MRALIRPRTVLAVLAIGAFGVAGSGVHVVRSGETLARIAVDHDTSVRELVEANGLADPDLILVGQRLTIPGQGPEPVVHVVRSGETLSEIATKYRTTSRAIADANGLRNINLIRVGQRLSITASSGGAGGSGSGGGTTSGGSQQRVGTRHTVQRGDTVAGIARRYNISAADFVEWNGIVNNVIYATTRLVLWDPGDLPRTGASGPSSHTVRNGETLGSIAARFGVAVSAIARASGISNPNLIRVGQQLTVPGASGSIQCPVPGATFINDWGFPRSGGRSHAGNDLFAPRGTPVRAPVAGRVDIATGRIGGHQFRLTAADGTLWFGSHMDRFGASGNVAAGTIVGYVGDSGNAKGGRPHLHFEVHPKGDEAVNPYPLLRSIC